MLRRTAILILALAAFSISAQTAPWPTKPIRIIVGYPPGGPTDAISRALGDRLSALLGQPVIVENKPGAGGNIGVAEAARSGRDGHTLVLLTSTTSALNPHLYASLGYDEKDIIPIAIVARATYTLVVRNGLPNDLKELAASIKAKPNTFSAATGNATSLVANYMLQKALGIDLVSVPYKGDAEAMTSIISGQTDLYFTVSGQLSSFLQAGKMKAIAVAGPHRGAILPTVPTFAESGLPNFFDLSIWYGIGTHASTPPELVERLNREITKIVASPEFKATLKTMGTEPATTNVAEARELIRADRARWQGPIKASGATVQ